ncbi:MAG TPA: type II secretion system protein GspL [Burkholderiaceae bacterium]|jgi:general secretion pathway protein L|nr:type II secretion system protein GspL [Burkholderiaceae bacterium]
MPTLIILLPAQPRIAAAPGNGPAVPDEYDYLVTADEQRVSEQGRAMADELPHATQAVVVLRPGDVAFQRVDIPRAPAARLRMALSAVMEDALLEDEFDVHLAVAPGAKPGTTDWIAVTNRRWLRAQLEALEAANVQVDSAVSAWWPDEGAAGHVFRQAGGEDAELMLAWRDEHGAICVPLASEVARALVTALPEDTPVRWTASPEAAAVASQFVGSAVAAVTDAEQALRATRSGWNLRQFDLASQRRGVRQVREMATRFIHDSRWRVTRIGIVALVVAEILGLNVRALQEHRAVAQKQEALAQKFKDTFPTVKSIYDPAAQAQKELDALRAAAGRPGNGDIETLLQAAESAWPPNHPPVDLVHYESGKLVLPATSWTPAEVAAFTRQLRAVNVEAQSAGGKLQLSHVAGSTLATRSDKQ